jgi:NAD+ synthase
MYQASGTGIEGNMAIDQTAFERDWQQQVIRELCVDAHFDANTELERRVAFLNDTQTDSVRTFAASAEGSIPRRPGGSPS